MEDGDVREFVPELSKWEQMSMVLKNPWDFIWKRPDPHTLGSDTELREWINPDLDETGERDGCEY